jgi:hypothetical protein
MPRLMRKLSRWTATTLAASAVAMSAHANGKLVATPGVTQVEGSGGGGLVPWAMLSGYASRDEWAGNAFYTRLSVDDLDFSAWGVGVNVRDRLELSLARQSLDVQPLNVSLDMDIVGAKLRLYGDVVYSRWPQVSVGVQHKRLRDKAVPLSVGAADTEGTDAYVAVSKLHLGALAGYNLLWSTALRATKANQLGLLGFGGDRNNDRELMVEASLAVLLNRHLALGLEYRQKPDNLGFAREQDWADLFLAWFPNKRVNVTVAWANLGDVAGLEGQRGIYASLTGYWH